MTFILRTPIILFGIVLVTLFVGRLVNWFLARGAVIGRTLGLRQRRIGVLVVVSLLASVLMATSWHWGVLGDGSRLRVLQRTAIARQSPPGVRLLSEESSVGERDSDHQGGPPTNPSPRSFHERTYRVEASLPEVLRGFDRIAADDGWSIVADRCGSYGSPGGQVGPQRDRRWSSRLYERRFFGFPATLEVTSLTLSSIVFRGTTIANVMVKLRAPSASSRERAVANRLPEEECTLPPAPLLTPAPPGACDAANAKLAVLTSEPAAPLGSPPVRVGPRRQDFTQVSEPRQLLKRHGAVGSHQTSNVVSTNYSGSPEYPAKTFAYEFPSHTAARAVHQEAVGRACRQAIESFYVPNIVDAVGLRLYVPAPSPDCNEHFYLQWGMTRLGSQCDDWVIDYVSFVRGQYQVTLLAGATEEEPSGPSGVRAAVLKQASGAA